MKEQIAYKLYFTKTVSFSRKLLLKKLTITTGLWEMVQIATLDLITLEFQKPYTNNI